LAAHQDDFVDLVYANAGIGQSFLQGSIERSIRVLDQLLSFGASELADQVLGPEASAVMKRQVDLGFDGGRELDFAFSAASFSR